MLKKLFNEKNFIYHFLFMCLVLFGIFFDHIYLDPILRRDDIFIIGPLEQITGFSQYFQALKSNFIVDLQPVRDLSFILNIKLQEIFHLHTYHLFNFVIFILISLFFYKILRAREVVYEKSLILLALFMFHPSVSIYLSWISARKHSLAILFILMAVHQIILRKKITGQIILYYALSILSHPITLLWPVWSLFYLKLSQSKNWKSLNLIILFLIMFIVAGLNFYKGFITGMYNVGAMDSNLSHFISQAVLSFGRIFINLLVPFRFSVEYFQGSILNILGLPLAIGFLYFAFKNCTKATFTIWSLLIASVLMTILQFFMADTYLGLIAIAILLLLGEMTFKKLNNAFKLIALFCIFYFSFKTYSVSRMWLNNYSLWLTSHENEKSPYTAANLGLYLSKQDKKLSLYFLKWSFENAQFEDDPRLLFNILSAITSAEDLSLDERISILDLQKVHHIYYDMFLGYLLVRKQDDASQKKGLELLQSIMANNEKLIFESGISNKLLNFCLSTKQPFVCNKLKL